MSAAGDLLLVEDNPSDAELMLESLARLDLQDRVHVVRDGDEALAWLFGGGRPRVVLLDVKLPKVGGFDVLRAMRSDPRTRHTPVVMFTSSNIERDVALAYDLGANGYVQKPVDFTRFREVVEAVGRYWMSINLTPRDDAQG